MKRSDEQALLRLGANIHSQGVSGLTLLFLAGMKGLARIVEFIVDVGVDSLSRGKFRDISCTSPLDLRHCHDYLARGAIERGIVSMERNRVTWLGRV